MPRMHAFGTAALTAPAPGKAAPGGDRLHGTECVQALFQDQWRGVPAGMQRQVATTH